MVDKNHDSSVDFTAVTNISTESSPTYLSNASMVVINEDTNNVTHTSPFKLVENSQNCSTEDCGNPDQRKVEQRLFGLSYF